MFRYSFEISTISQRNVKSLVDFEKHSGHELFHTYQCVSIFGSKRQDVAAVIGMMALSDADRFGVPMGVIAQSVPDLVNAGLMHLAMDPQLWRFVGSEESTAEPRAAITKGSEHSRRHEIEQLLGIFERRSSPFLFLDRHRVLTAGNENRMSSPAKKHGFSMVFDAAGYAEELRAQCPGALFTIETKEEK